MVDLKAYVKAEIQKNQYDPQVTSRPYEVNTELRRECGDFKDHTSVTFDTAKETTPGIQNITVSLFYLY